MAAEMENDVGKIRIVSNGVPNDTVIEAVDDAGSVTPLIVDSIEFALRASRPVEPGWLKLSACVNNSIELEIPANELVVLGPKCRISGCLEPARFAVWWPGPARILCCEHCANRWKAVADRGFGFALAMQPLYYVTAEDDSVQRFRAIELT